MIPVAIKKYWSGENAYCGFNEISYPQNWATFFDHYYNYWEKMNTGEHEYMNQNTYFYHCLPVVLGITQTYKGSPAIAVMEEFMAGARDYGVSRRCKLMV